MIKIKELKNYFFQFLDVFLPKVCAGCERKLDPNKEIILCNSCNSSIEKLNDNELQEFYNDKFLSENLISGFISLFLFEKGKNLQNAIHKLKYESRIDIGEFFGLKIAQYYQNEIKYLWKIDLIIPIPLHKVKYKERGYNQAYYIAKGISENLQIPIDEKSLQRGKYTSTQTKLNKSERKSNVKNVFCVPDNSEISNKNILLIDDVVTTGATTLECARILKNNGADNIYLATIAIADK